jgi:hypothetical protein
VLKRREKCSRKKELQWKENERPDDSNGGSGRLFLKGPKSDYGKPN